MNQDPTKAKPATAFVLLAHGFGGENWNRRWRAGEIVGLNEPWAYGYFHAQSEGLRVVYSEDAAENPASALWRKATRAILGFDFVHAWRNRRALFAADAVWTHTESQSLAALALCRLFPRRRAPKTILQSVWLIDGWERQPFWRKWLYRKLLERGDILTFLSPLNCAAASRMFPRLRCETVLYGVAADAPRAPRAPSADGVLHLTAPGNDRHRDWRTLIAAVRGMDGVDLTIVSGTCPEHLVEGAANVKIARPKTNAELLALYEATDGVVVPLTENLHASGSTAVEEATQMGRAVIVTNIGGIDAYFGADCVAFFPARDIAALRAAILSLKGDPDAALARIVAAQTRMREGGVNSRAYAIRHAEWTRELLALPAPAKAR